MKITSPAFEHNTSIPEKYACCRPSGSPASSCAGVDISPPLVISGTPDRAKSLVLIVDDPDAPSGTWVHWTVWNIPSGTQIWPEKSVPTGAVQGMTSAGSPGYAGPCPPTGTHHYFFKVFALDVTLDLPATTDAAGLESAMGGHILDKAGLIGLYRGAQ